MKTKQIELIRYRKNVFSENGEDGIIEKIFSEIIPKSNTCCEFGAWDGIWASNCRNLIKNHNWKATMIEGDSQRYDDLINTYQDNKNVQCINAFVDNNNNSLSQLLKPEIKDNLGFLSIDIDGLDYEIFDSLDFYPQVVCIEVNCGHEPESNNIISRNIASNNIGQSLFVINEIAKSKGYKLVCYTGNAFFIKESELIKSKIRAMSCKEAYLDHIHTVSKSVREHLYFVNKGLVNPYYKFHNKYLSRKYLELNYLTIFKKFVSVYWRKVKRRMLSIYRPVRNKLLGYFKS